MRVISRTVGKGGPEVPAIGLGCMVLSGSYGPVDEKESLATLHRALSPPFLGLAARSPGRKLGAQQVHLTPADLEHIRELFPQSAVAGERYTPEVMARVDRS